MGEIAEMMMDGTLCSQCGVFIDDETEGGPGPQGFPRLCRHCQRGDDRRPKNRKGDRSHRRRPGG